MENEFEDMGLGNTPERDWPSVSGDGDTQPIDRLKPKSEAHSRVLAYLKDRLEHSERKMSQFYERWEQNEKRKQAYIDLDTYEQTLKDDNDNGEAPSPVKIIVPYIFATNSAIVTYQVHAFMGRKPMFQVGTYKPEVAGNARSMETKLQYDADHTRLIGKLFQFLQDGQDYGLGVLRVAWNKKQAMRTVIKPPGVLGGLFSMLQPGASEGQKSRELRTVFEGNEITNIDPYMFFPDPRVPMTEAADRGEYVFWREFSGKHELKMLEAEGKIKYVNAASSRLPQSSFTGDSNQSSRALRAGGESSPADEPGTQFHRGERFYQVDQGTCWIIPAELGLGDGDAPELWIFTILNKSQIVQAEPFETDYGHHPNVVIEPYTTGYGFGNLGMADYCTPMQDIQSWLINSHMENVRLALNNMFVVNPNTVEMQDLQRPGPGKIIRAKAAAFGQDMRQLVHQLQVSDVTSSHFASLEGINRIADAVSSVNDNIRGLQENSGRKSATEVRTSAESGASRLAAQAKLISTQGMVPMTEMMSLNNQQYLSEEFMIQVLGKDGQENPITVKPEHLVGDFYYPVHDGTLPIDRVAMVDVWKEIFLAVSGDEMLRSQFNLIEMFKHVAELSGAKNVEKFQLGMEQDPAVLQQQAQQGNIVPIQEAGGLPGGRGSVTPGVEPSPRNRLEGLDI